MASSNSASIGEGASMDEAELAKVWADLLKGEKTAGALESSLTNLEKKIDDLLDSFEESERLKVEEASSTAVEPEDVAREETVSRVQADFKPPAPLVEANREDGKNPKSSGLISKGN